MKDKRQLKCPVCDQTTLIKEGIRETKLENVGHYSGYLIKKGIKSIKYYKCDNCRWIIAHPMVEKCSLRELYEDIIPTHPHGKRNYEAFKASEINKTIERNRQIYKLLVEKEISLRDYAEIGCPYQGLLSLLPKMILGSNKKNTITYLDETQKEFWGKNCKLESKLCKATLPEHIKNTSIKESMKAGREYDLIGIFNYIDHTEEPLLLLEKLRQISKRLLLVTHNPDTSGPQHRYMLDKDAIEYTFKDYKRLEFLKLEQEHYNYVIAFAER